jgi:hypothetical protein
VLCPLVYDTLSEGLRVMCDSIYQAFKCLQVFYLFFLQLKTLMVLYPVVNWWAGNGAQGLRGGLVQCTIYSFHTLPITL